MKGLLNRKVKIGESCSRRGCPGTRPHRFNINAAGALESPGRHDCHPTLVIIFGEQSILPSAAAEGSHKNIFLAWNNPSDSKVNQSGAHD
jgi:hypothetical protein